MAAEAVPERIRWAAEFLLVTPTDRLLEIGCGGGVAVALICPLLSTGHIAAIDRSETMTARAQRRNADHIRAGRATIHTATFDAADLAAARLDEERYDKIFAINVNLFWTGQARDELILVRNLLAPDGALYLFYEPPGDRTDEIIGKVTDTLTASEFTAQATRSASALGIIARPRQRS